MAAYKTLGFIGLGVMGEPICRNLVKKSGAPVMAFDLAPEPLERLRKEGATIAGSVAEVVGRCDIVFLCLPSARHVRGVFEGDGILKNIRKGQVVVEHARAHAWRPKRTRYRVADKFSHGAGDGRAFLAQPLERLQRLEKHHSRTHFLHEVTADRLAHHTETDKAEGLVRCHVATRSFVLRRFPDANRSPLRLKRSARTSATWADMTRRHRPCRWRADHFADRKPIMPGDQRPRSGILGRRCHVSTPRTCRLSVDDRRIFGRYSTKKCEATPTPAAPGRARFDPHHLQAVGTAADPIKRGATFTLAEWKVTRSLKTWRTISMFHRKRMPQRPKPHVQHPVA